MPGKWQLHTLGDLCSLITDGKHGDCRDEDGSGYYFLSVKDVFGDRMVYDNARQITESDFAETHRRTNLIPGDILFTNTGTIGRMAIAPDDPKTAHTTFQKSVAILKPKRDIILSRFLYYVLRFDNTRLSDFAAGTTQKNLLLKDLRAFTVRVPLLAEQESIAAVLGAFDDKIELNRRMNTTLEAMARALFQSWFVDFDPVRAKLDGRKPTGLDEATAPLFTSTFQDSEAGHIPKGWEVRSLDKTANYLNGLALQKYPPGDSRTLPVIKIAQLRKGDSVGADRCNTNLPPEYVVQDGDVLFSWSGSLEVELWCGGDGALNQHLFKVTSDEFPKWYYYLWTLYHLDEFRLIAAGKATTMGHIQRGHLSTAKVLVPPRPLLDSMTRIMSSLIDRIIANRIQCHTLASLRDTLLPKLLGGALPISKEHA